MTTACDDEATFLTQPADSNANPFQRHLEMFPSHYGTGHPTAQSR